MKIHLGSFLVGVAVGASGVALAKKLRPVTVELAALGIRLADAARTRLALGKEAFEDMLAEARAKARGLLDEVEGEEARSTLEAEEAAA